jgi:FKBP-type peptidyl-prolyl cis-trans isomerase
MRPLLIVAVLLAAGIAPALAVDAPTPAAVQAFLASHARAPGVTVRASGLQVRTIKNGIGRRISPRDGVQIYYTAKLADGRVVDSTSPGLPAPIDLSNTLPGLGEGLQQMREGDHWELTLPPALAFGAKGSNGGGIPPGQALVFDITVAQVTPAAAVSAAGPSNGFSFAAGAGESHAYYTIHP